MRPPVQLQRAPSPLGLGVRVLFGMLPLWGLTIGPACGKRVGVAKDRALWGAIGIIAYPQGGVSSKCKRSIQRAGSFLRFCDNPPWGYATVPMPPHRASPCRGAGFPLTGPVAPGTSQGRQPLRGPVAGSLTNWTPSLDGASQPLEEPYHDSDHVPARIDHHQGDVQHSPRDVQFWPGEAHRGHRTGR